jgi:hypothetical protein
MVKGDVMRNSPQELFAAKPQVIKDKGITGLTLEFYLGRTYNILTIYGDFEFGHRDFYFTKSGYFAGTGTAVGECQRDGS